MIWLVLLGGIVIGAFLGLMMASWNAVAMVEAARAVAEETDRHD